jgi:hypothetical protein
MTNIAHSLETFSKLVTANVAKLILFPFKPLLQPLDLTALLTLCYNKMGIGMRGCISRNSKEKSQAPAVLATSNESINTPLKRPRAPDNFSSPINFLAELVLMSMRNMKRIIFSTIPKLEVFDADVVLVIESTGTEYKIVQNNAELNEIF